MSAQTDHPRRDKRFPYWRSAAQCAMGIIGVAGLTYVGFRLGFDLATVGFSYVALIALLSLTGSFIGSILVSVIAVGCLNYFFTEPLFSFQVTYPQDVVALAGFMTTSIVIAGLTGKARKSSEALRQREQQWREVFEHTPTMYFMLDAAGTVVSVNAFGAAQLGYTVDELVGKSVLKVFFAEDREQAKANVAVCLATLGQQHEWELRKIRKDGTLLWVRENAKAVRRVGNDAVVLIACEDITARKLAEDALRDSEQRFRDYAETASDWLWETGADHRFTSFLGREPEIDLDFVGGIGRTRWERATDFDEEPEKWQEHRAALDARQPFRGFTYRTQRSDGSAVYVATSGKPVFDKEGRFLGYRGVATDVTAAVRAEHAEQALHEARAELAHATRLTALGELTASIAHEVNQPLTAIATDAGAGRRWLAGTSPDLAEVRQVLDRIARNSTRAADVIGRIRTLAKKSSIRLDPLQINEIIREVIALTRGEIARHQIGLRTELAEDLPTIAGDRVQLQQVVLNLVLNAIEAMSEGEMRELVVSSRADEAQNVVVAVQDSGRGLDARDTERVFAAFYTTKSGGLGMGLAICRSAIEAHGGRLWASANVPRGACFQFALPAHPVVTPTTQETARPS